MKNKYEEAYKNVFNGIINNKTIKLNDLHTLHELVDKEEPKMLINNYCPYCFFKFPQSALFLKTRCWNCGQKIDWSDE